MRTRARRTESSAMFMGMSTPGVGMASMCGPLEARWWGRYRLRVGARACVSGAMGRCGVLGRRSYGGCSWAVRLGERSWTYKVRRGMGWDAMGWSLEENRKKGEVLIT